MKRTALATMLLFGVAASASAQRGGGGAGGHGSPHPAPPVSTPSPASKGSMRGDEGVSERDRDADHRMKDSRKTGVQRATPATRAVPAVPGTKGTRATRAVRAVPATPSARSMSRDSKAENKSERREFSDARHQSKEMLKGVHLSATYRRQAKAIDKKYDAQFKALEKQERDAEKSGKSDASIMAQLAQLRAQENADVQALLNANHQAQFNRDGTRPAKH